MRAGAGFHVAVHAMQPEQDWVEQRREAVLPDFHRLNPSFCSLSLIFFLTCTPDFALPLIP